MQSSLTAPYVKLNNGILMPQIGLGVFKLDDGRNVEQAIEVALDSGYRGIDTASLYGNEEGVGRVIARSNIPREELFITSKLWNDDHGFDTTLKAFDTSLKKLNADYLDLYLVHWPLKSKQNRAETWRAMEQIYESGRARAIGVSNFTPSHLDELLKTAKVVPAINQVELHPYLTQIDIRSYCDSKGIIVQSWSPIMRGGDLLTDPVITGIANVYGKEPAQIVLCWHIQLGLIVIPKSKTPERIRSNINIFNFELTNEEMQRISGLNKNMRIGPDPDSFS